MGRSVAEKIIAEHLVDGDMEPGEPIGLRIDQTLTQDATGTLVMLELEAMDLERVRTKLSAQYIDHNLIQEDHKNPDDHLFLKSACERFGVWYSRPGNGVSHPVHQERFGVPGATLAGADSHSPAAGAIGMLAIGSGGMDVALAMAGEPLHIRMPRIWGVRLTGEMPDWCSAKDVILEMLRRHGADGGFGRVIEYYGPGLAELSCMDRHVICNMGAELGATSSVFPSDGEVRVFLRRNGREEDWRELTADGDVSYDIDEEIDLSELIPLIAKPSNPDNVVPVSEVAGRPIVQSYVGSSANPGYRDFAVVAEICRRVGQQAHPRVSLDVNPTSRQILENLINQGHLASLVHAGARLHQAGCNGCIGMGQAPASEEISLRTTPRNFPGRSGTKEDRVYLCSPETAVASALTGEITDPRDLGDKFGIEYPRITEPPDGDYLVNADAMVPPPPPEESAGIELRKGPNIASLPDFDPLPDTLELPIVLKVGDDISTDEILRAGAEVLPFRSNIPRISDFTFDVVDPTYPERAREVREQGQGHAVVAGINYGQGSSREHAALAPRYLGLRVTLVREYARIAWQNLANFGVLPLQLDGEDDYDAFQQGDIIRLENLRRQLLESDSVVVTNVTRDQTVTLRHTLSEAQVGAVLAGGIINVMRERLRG